jgi:hypothetical protein
MKTYMILTDTGPIVILTSHASLDESLLERLATKGIDKFVACEIPLNLAQTRYGTHFSVVKGDLRESEELRILDGDGVHAFKLFRFDELGPPTQHESPAHRQRQGAMPAQEHGKSEIPRYFIQLTNGRQVLDNHVGVELPGSAAARDVALRMAHDLRQGAAMPGWNWGGWFVAIVDEHGRKIDEIPIAAA